MNKGVPQSRTRIPPPAPAIHGTMTPARTHIMLDKEMKEALQNFIGQVWLMRKAQDSGNAIQRARYEMEVDRQLAILVKADKKEVNHA
jgi:hypothetical protein